MILIDTNVISEVMRSEPDGRVKAWLNGQMRGEVGITSITVAEVLCGIWSLPEGRRRNQLLGAAAEVFGGYLSGRIFAFDHRAAVEYAEIVVGRERIGTPISMADAQIAAICLANSADLATRNTKDFDNTGIALFNPWTES
jgi:toxin FitB